MGVRKEGRKKKTTEEKKKRGAETKSREGRIGEKLGRAETKGGWEKGRAGKGDEIAVQELINEHNGRSRPLATSMPKVTQACRKGTT